MTRLYELGRDAAKRNDPGAYILNDEAAAIVEKFKKGSDQWHEAIKEFVSGYSTEKIKSMGK